MAIEQAAPRLRTRPPRRVRINPGPLLSERVDPGVFADITEGGDDPYGDASYTDLPEGIGDRFRFFTRHGREYAKDYVDKTLHYLMLRGASTHEIAREFRVNVRTVGIWKKRLRERFTREAEVTDFRPLFRETILFFEEARGLALQQYASASAVKDKIACLNSAVRSTASMSRFLTSCGFFENRSLPDLSDDDPFAARAARIVGEIRSSLDQFAIEDHSEEHPIIDGEVVTVDDDVPA